jgi:thymidine phosphorylase
MSKKLAETLDALVLDVKFGSAAFMPELAQAESLAGSLIAIGQAVDLPTRVLLTSMEQPLGRMVGNACEVNEALEVLEGSTQSPLAQVTLALCSQLLLASGRSRDMAHAHTLLTNELNSGRPLRRFQQMVEAQNGIWRDRWPTAPAEPVLAEQAGYVSAIDGRRLGHAVIELGGGRKVLGQPIDHRVGLEMLVRLGDAVSPGQPLVRIMAQRGPALEIAQRLVQQAISISPSGISQQPLIRTL